MKKLLSVVLSILLTITILPTTIFMVSAATSGTCGEDLTWEFDDATGILSISGTGKMEDFLYSLSPWYSYRSSIQEIAFGKGITYIGEYAFTDCTVLERANIPNGVIAIGKEAFYRCGNLTEVSIPNSVTSIGAEAFIKCYNLKVNIDSIEAWCNINQTITDFAGSPFNTLRLYLNGEKITRLEIPDTVKNIRPYAFDGCVGLTEVVIHDSVTSIGSHAFCDCTGITEIAIPNSIQSLGARAFEGCVNLDSVYLPDITTWLNIDGDAGDIFSQWVDMGTVVRRRYVPNIYFDNKVVSELVIPSSITSIKEGAFFGCHTIKSVILHENVKSIKSTAFYDCRNLSEVTLSRELEFIGERVFGQCDKLKTVNNYSFLDLKKDYYGALDENFSGCINEFTIPTLLSKAGTSVTLKQIDGFEYSKDGVNWQKSNIFYGLTPGTSYSFYIREEGSQDNSASETLRALLVKTKNLNFETPQAPSLLSKTASSIVLKSMDGYEYSMDGKNWQSSAVFENLKTYTTYSLYQRIKETEDYEPSDSSKPLYVTTNSKKITITYQTNGGTNAPTSITALSHVMYISDTIPQKDGYRFMGWNSFEDNSMIYSPGEKYKGDADAVLYAVWVPICKKCAGDGEIFELCNHCGGRGYLYSYKRNCNSCGYPVYFSNIRQCPRCYSYDIRSDQTRIECGHCQSVGSFTWSCTICTGIGYISETKPIIASYSDTYVKLLKKIGYEYSMDKINWQQSNVFTDLNPDTVYSFYQRVAATSETTFGYPSGETVLTTKAAGEQPSLLFGGDIDGDGHVAASDALLALQIATHKVEAIGDQKTMADVDGDDEVTANDALLILQYATKKIDAF